MTTAIAQTTDGKRLGAYHRAAVRSLGNPRSVRNVRFEGRALCADVRMHGELVGFAYGNGVWCEYDSPYGRELRGVADKTTTERSN